MATDKQPSLDAGTGALGFPNLRARNKFPPSLLSRPSSTHKPLLRAKPPHPYRTGQGKRSPAFPNPTHLPMLPTIRCTHSMASHMPREQIFLAQPVPKVPAANNRGAQQTDSVYTWPHKKQIPAT